MKKQPPASIMLSQRPHMLYLEHARVMQKDGRVLYLTAGSEKLDHFFNIPHNNTAFLMLGKGTSITDSAARMLADANVMVGFCGSGGSPLFSGTDFTFLSPQEEYRPTEYMQAWMRMWLDDDLRLRVAKSFLKTRIEWTEEAWSKSLPLLKNRVSFPSKDADKLLVSLRSVSTTEALLSAEGHWAKAAYKALARGFNIADFTRQENPAPDGSAMTMVNGMLNHGNYLAYGIAAVALHALGISFALPVLHGKTRRGGLVFDIADLFKDFTSMPLAFIHGHRFSDESEFRSDLMNYLQDEKVLDRTINAIKGVLVAINK